MKTMSLNVDIIFIHEVNPFIVLHNTLKNYHSILISCRKILNSLMLKLYIYIVVYIV